MDLIQIIGLLFLLTIILIIIWKSIRIVRPTQRGIIERFGKYRTVVGDGLHIIIPLVDQMIFVNITEQMVDADPQEVITKDNLNATVDAQIYFKVKPDIESIKKSQYSVYAYRLQIVALARTTLRDIIGKMSFKKVNSERETLNERLAKELEAQTGAWGIEVVRTELKEIEPPEDVQATMNKVLKAENEKIAADDYATAKETQADGERRATIKGAQGKARAIELEANAKAKAIEVISTASEKYFKDRAEAKLKLDVLDNTLKNNTKIIVPSGSDLINVLGLSDEKVLPIKKKSKHEIYPEGYRQR